MVGEHLLYQARIGRECPDCSANAQEGMPVDQAATARGNDLPVICLGEDVWERRLSLHDVINALVDPCPEDSWIRAQRLDRLGPNGLRGW